MIEIEERKGVRVSTQELLALLKSPDPRGILKKIEETRVKIRGETEIGDKVRLICRDGFNDESYVVAGRVVEIRSDEIIIQGQLMPYPIPYSRIESCRLN